MELSYILGNKYFLNFGILYYGILRTLAYLDLEAYSEP